MVQNSKMKTIGKGLLSWAAVIVLAVSVIIFTTIRGHGIFFSEQPDEYSPMPCL